MTRKDDVFQAAGANSANGARREPSLADLEAFERLLRDSLKVDPAAPEPSSAPAVEPPALPISADSALAEFNRMIEAPVSFDTRGQPASPAQISAIERAFQDDLANPIAPKPQLPPDPMLDFEEELRRFEALSRPAQNPNPVEPVEPLRPAYAGDASAHQPETQWQQPQPGPEAWHTDAHVAENQALDAAERRLSAEAEAGALAGGAALAAGGAAVAAGASRARSRGVFYALGGVAVAGLAVVGGMAMFSGKSNVAGGGNVPVIAAKPEPAKERPANPGGLEVPDQNKQVLSPRAAPPDARAQQVINQTEQPVDLNQVARRDSVRIITPSPFQPAPGATPPTESPPAATTQPGEPPAAEPRRVQSVRLSDPVAPTPQPTPVLPSPGGISPGAAAAGAAIGAIAAGAAATPSRPQAGSTTPGAQAAIRPQTPPTPAAAPSAPAPAPIAAPAAPQPPKAETRPQSPTAPRPAQAQTPPRQPQANAPLPLNNNRANQPAPAAQPPRVANSPTSGGGFAIQLASRPSENDARNASTQLGQRYSSQIGGRSTTVVRGEANGQTVYRVRALGFSQADANAACDRIRASGGACFVTRQ